MNELDWQICVYYYEVNLIEILKFKKNEKHFKEVVTLFCTVYVFN